MRGLRQHLSCTLWLWLGCQVLALAAPVALAATAATSSEELCTCAGGDHDTCPMHHGRQAEVPSAAICGVASCWAPVDIALLSMAGGAGVLPAGIHLPGPDLSASVINLQPVSLDGPVSFDTPPPRL